MKKNILFAFVAAVIVSASLLFWQQHLLTSKAKKQEEFAYKMGMKQGMAVGYGDKENERCYICFQPEFLENFWGKYYPQKDSLLTDSTRQIESFWYYDEDTELIKVKMKAKYVD